MGDQSAKWALQFTLCRPSLEGSSTAVARKQSRDLSFRMGAAALGMFAGMALGLAFGCLSASLASFVFGGAAAGLVTGMVFPDAAVSMAEGTVHFFIGLFRAGTELITDASGDFQFRASSQTPWLVVAFTFGAVYAVVLWFLL
jgi:hypothetical protein